MRAGWLVAALAWPAVALGAKGAGQPLPELPAAWGGPARDGAVGDAAWWGSLGGAELAALVDEGLAGNLDLAAADARVAQAEALQLQAIAALVPSLSFDANLQASPANRRFIGFTGDIDESVDPALLFYQGTAGFNGAWELDLTGRGVLGVQAAAKDRAAGVSDRESQASSLASRIAGAWFDAALQAQRLELLGRLAEANRGVIEVVELRLARGEATAVDVLQARQQLLNVEAQIPLVRAALAIAGQQLAVLVGRTPDRAPATLPRSLPEIGGAPTAGRPTDLPENRPELRALSLRLDAAWQRRAAAERALLPSFRASANGGWSFTNNAGAIAFGLPNPDAPDEDFRLWWNWGVGAQVSVPIFNLRAIAAARQARAAERVAASQLGQAELAAMSQVEASLAQDREQGVRLDAVRGQVRAAREAFETARARYAEGIGDFLSLLTSQVTWQNAEVAELQAHRDALGARIQLHEALGGAWTRNLAGDDR